MRKNMRISLTKICNVLFGRRLAKAAHCDEPETAEIGEDSGWYECRGRV
jgi:hypothetical protein